MLQQGGPALGRRLALRKAERSAKITLLRSKGVATAVDASDAFLDAAIAEIDRTSSVARRK
jgi:hypothetical protein